MNYRFVLCQPYSLLSLSPFEFILHASSDLFEEIVELPDVALFAGHQKNQLLGVRFLEELYCTGEGPRELIVYDVDTRGKALVLERIREGVVNISIERFYYHAKVGKQPQRVLLCLKIQLSEVEHVRSECLWSESLLSELLLICLDCDFIFIIIMTGALDLFRIG